MKLKLGALALFFFQSISSFSQTSDQAGVSYEKDKEGRVYSVTTIFLAYDYATGKFEKHIQPWSVKVEAGIPRDSSKDSYFMDIELRAMTTTVQGNHHGEKSFSDLLAVQYRRDQRLGINHQLSVYFLNQGNQVSTAMSEMEGIVRLLGLVYRESMESKDPNYLLSLGQIKMNMIFKLGSAANLEFGGMAEVLGGQEDGNSTWFSALYQQYKVYGRFNLKLSPATALFAETGWQSVKRETESKGLISYSTPAEKSFTYFRLGVNHKF